MKKIVLAGGLFAAASLAVYAASRADHGNIAPQHPLKLAAVQPFLAEPVFSRNNAANSRTANGRNKKSRTQRRLERKIHAARNRLTRTASGRLSGRLRYSNPLYI